MYVVENIIAMEPVWQMMFEVTYEISSKVERQSNPQIYYYRFQKYGLPAPEY